MLRIVATPIGNLGDMTERGLQALRAAQVLACEDTRRTRILLTHFQIPAPPVMLSYRQGNEERVGERLVADTAAGREVVICGDWNIAHQEIDLKNWKSNRKNSGFLPEERAWVSRVLGEGGWCDVYRKLHPTTTDECYTWWSNRGQAWAKNVGWRLDYQLATVGISDSVMGAAIYKEQRFSDHAPLTVDYDWNYCGE